MLPPLIALRNDGKGGVIGVKGGLYLNNERIDADDATLTREALLTETPAVVRKGKKNYHLLRFE